MATKLSKIGSVPGMDVVRLFMEIVRDQKKYDAIVSEIDEKTAKANDLIELIAPANQIETLHAEAKALVSKAEEYERNIHAECARALEATDKEVMKGRKLSKEIMDNATAHAERTKEERATFEAEKAEAEKSLQARQVSLDSREDVVSQRETVLVAQTKAHEKRVEKIDRALH